MQRSFRRGFEINGSAMKLRAPVPRFPKTPVALRMRTATGGLWRKQLLEKTALFFRRSAACTLWPWLEGDRGPSYPERPKKTSCDTQVPVQPFPVRWCPVSDRESDTGRSSMVTSFEPVKRPWPGGSLRLLAERYLHPGFSFPEFSPPFSVTAVLPGFERSPLRGRLSAHRATPLRPSFKSRQCFKNPLHFFSPVFILKHFMVCPLVARP